MMRFLGRTRITGASLDRTSRLSRFHDDDGAVAVVFAVCLILVMGAAALALDAGSLWLSRRSLVTDTDAAALHAALTLLEGGVSECLDAEGLDATSSSTYQAALDTLTDNARDASQQLEGVTVTPTDGLCTNQSGRVQVSASMDATMLFSGIFGFTDLGTSSTSIAQYGPIVAANYLRPFGICALPNPDTGSSPFQELVAAGGDVQDAAYKALDGVDYALTTYLDHPTQTTASGQWGDGVLYSGRKSVVHRVTFRDPASSPCNTTGASSGGNWGWFDFDGSAGGSNDVADRILHGYDGWIDLDAPNCNENEPTTTACPPETGAMNSLKGDLLTMTCPPSEAPDGDVCTPLQMTILAYDDVKIDDAKKGKGGGGGNVRYEPHAVVGVVLRDWSDGVLSGNPNADAYFDLEFIRLTRNGVIGRAPNGANTGVVGVQLCGIDSPGSGGLAVTDNCDV